jgi:predicted nucleic acid-binding Zn ribbon protein
MGLVCASCGAEHAPGARFCSECGAPLQRTCPACGFEQPAGATFCSNCGIALRDDARRAGDASDDRQERRVVTVLFADLAGSTALGERLDPEDVRELQGELFELDRRLERGANEGRIRTGAARLRKPVLTQAGIPASTQC